MNKYRLHTRMTFYSNGECGYIPLEPVLEKDTLFNPPMIIRTGTDKDNASGEDIVCYAIPNPATNETEVYYQVPGSSDADVSIELYGVLGNQIMEVFKGRSSVGLNHVKLNANELVNGAYFIKVTIGRNTASFPVVILK